MSESLPRLTKAPQDTRKVEERRREPRFSTSVQVDVAIQKPWIQKFSGTVLAAFHCGLRLELPLAVTEGTHVRINLKDMVVFGEIGPCEATALGFATDVLVKEVSGPERLDQLNDSELDLCGILVQCVQLASRGPEKIVLPPTGLETEKRCPAPLPQFSITSPASVGGGQELMDSLKSDGGPPIARGEYSSDFPPPLYK